MGRQVIERRLSFNGGEISPWVGSRVDLEKYRSSCREMTNWPPSIYGMAKRRPGTVYLGPAKTAAKQARLVAFEFSATDSLVLEFGDQYFRAWTTGSGASQVEVTTSAWVTSTAYVVGDAVTDSGTSYYCLEDHTSGTFATDLAAGKWHALTGDVFEMPTNYLEAELFELQFAQLNDQIWISHPNHWPRVLSRVANDSWTLADVVPEWPATRDENITATTIAASAVTGSGITLTASADLFDADQDGGYWVLIERRTTPYVEMNLNSAVATDSTAALYVLGEWSIAINSTSSGYGTWSADVIVQRSYDKSTWETLRTVTSQSNDVNQLLTGTEIEPAWLRIYYQAKTGTPPSGLRAVLEAVDPNHYGIVKLNRYNSATSFDADVVWELGATTATKRWQESAWSDYRGHPRAVAIHQLRLIFGGNTGEPSTIWGSVIDDFTNFRVAAEADQGLRLRLQDANAIQWMVSQEDLAVGTTGAEWIVAGGDTETAITPENVVAKRNTNYGSRFLQAQPVNDATLFIQRNGRRLREFIFRFERDRYVAPEMSMLAEHIATDAICQTAVQKSPETIVWMVTGDLQLLGMTYERDQQVISWHEHGTGADGDGFESVAVVPTSNEEDEVWVIAKRAIDGGTVRYVERFPLSHLENLRAGLIGDLVYLDSAVEWSGSSTTAISGLDHLEGETLEGVATTAGGTERVTGLTVASGAVTLPTAATKLKIGLVLASTLEPTYLAGNDPASVAFAGKTQLQTLVLDVWNSLGLEYSVDGGTTWFPIEFRNLDDYLDTSPALRTGMFEVPVLAQTERQAHIKLRSIAPFPANVRGMYLKTQVDELT